ncbi:sialate O-acetylesterase [[Clostridium] polysaccharolyticum]|uniref:Sialate O-acetylesterase n=1 Tax=[Clostridium] polysaccharolyticum TaxID=29364 RepID=A0A1I0F677_9FIRM|nr:sialate O-acetylesterase [[Clostridium] polysaccharolyticum]SET52578.1 sialate O-acetylesterase [[Clostridium] polysaccharolyticum]
MEGKLKPAQIFGDGMVLQRNQNVVIWGEGRNNSNITVSINGHKVSTKVIECKWSVEIPRMEAGGPYTLSISDNFEEVVYEDVMIGEVWLAGGQSNMELELQNSYEGIKEVKAADNDFIRFYNVAKIATLEETDLEEEAKSIWNKVNSDIAGKMSAVAYYTAKKLQQELGIAIGVIDCYWGGCSISCWISEEYMESDMNAHIYFTEWQELVGEKSIEEYEEEVKKFDIELKRWIQKEEELKEDNPDITMWDVIELIGNCPWERPVGYKSPKRPAGLYHTMIQRIAPYTIKGVLWYQGEEDTGKAAIYDKMLYKLIEQWRKDWKNEALPFYIVQLPMWIEKGAEDDKSWAVLRNMQRKVTQTIKNTYLIVLIDCGEFDNIHPLDKKTVGLRLALQILKYSYEYKELYVEGPKYLQRDLKDGRIVLYFEHVCDGFEIKGDKRINLFEVAGCDKEFVEADAVIVGNTIEVSNKQVKNPKYARYGWTNYGIVNLFNGKGFPMEPFMTM